MLNNPILKAKDTISASLAECFITIDGNRYNFMQAINLEAKVEKTFHLQKYFSFSFVVSSQTPHQLMPRFSFAGLPFLSFVPKSFKLILCALAQAGRKFQKV